ncbi:methyl-accepting chemotaxis protein [Fictibacillus phosphorivorans]|uniref:methyl-accepting chemotaxis protein n=1 Tax=Fictibacillus phosphorivorans TaxID=1221500 RepID=UPI001292DF6F|nr:HAMP domain-containing methyl-accepting chemotaxis protein [Fictibacillus phosphorivorans]MQR94932.1 methyl-accepting chemotaxis protein [Fictibacillus phosphorivorans]
MKFNIRAKLISSFLIILSLLVAISVVAFIKMDGMGKKAEEINNVWTPSLVYLGGMNGNISDIQRVLLSIILTERTSEIEKLEESLDGFIKKLNDRSGKYAPLIDSNKEQKMYDEFAGDINTYIDGIPAVIEAKKANNMDLANKLQLEMDKGWNSADGHLRSLIEINEKGATLAADSSVDLFKDGSRFVTLFSVIAVLLGFAVALYISHLISKPLLLLSQQAGLISNGDLTGKNLSIKNRDEIGELARSFEQMKNNLVLLISQIKGSSQMVAASSEQLLASAEQNSEATQQIAGSIQEMASGSDNQVKNVGESSLVISEMSAGIQQIAASATNVSTTSQDSLQLAYEGNQSMDNMVKQMETIDQSLQQTGKAIQSLGVRSLEIDQIVDVITNISSQTNLLALNAAIEAARAGEHGRGFAVVADEVRKLAEQSAASANQISQLIHSIQVDTKEAVQSMELGNKELVLGISLAQSSGESFRRILSSIEDVSQQVNEISAASEQVAVGTEQVVKSIDFVSQLAISSASGAQNVSAATEEQLASMEEIASSANSLSTMAEELQEATSQFKL